METINNPRWPHKCIIRRKVEDDDPMVDDEYSTIIYKGVCRSFPANTTSTNGDVIVSSRKLSLPIKQNEWGTDKPIPLEGDQIEVDKGSCTEIGYVIDKIPGNLGTHILWSYGRN